jgi:hypothetical protein
MNKTTKFWNWCCLQEETQLLDDKIIDSIEVTSFLHKKKYYEALGAQ